MHPVILQFCEKSEKHLLFSPGYRILYYSRFGRITVQEAITVTNKPFRVIDPAATGANILRLRKERGLTVRDLQTYFGFEEPQAIYKWQRGQSLPSVDNLYALGALLEVPLDEILVQARPQLNMLMCEQQAGTACCSPLFLPPAAGDAVEAQDRVTIFARGACRPHRRAAGDGCVFLSARRRRSSDPWILRCL